MLDVSNIFIRMLSVVMLSVVILSVIILYIIMFSVTFFCHAECHYKLDVVMLIGAFFIVMLSVAILNVANVAHSCCQYYEFPTLLLS